LAIVERAVRAALDVPALTLRESLQHIIISVFIIELFTLTSSSSTATACAGSATAGLKGSSSTLSNGTNRLQGRPHSPPIVPMTIKSIHFRSSNLNIVRPETNLANIRIPVTIDIASLICSFQPERLLRDCSFPLHRIVIVIFSMGARDFQATAVGIWRAD
jgi:hypothetical protein